MKHYDKLCERFLSSRTYYPRGLQLSDEFLEAFKKEYNRLAKAGQNKKSLCERITKALKFHVK